jgi:PIN domain nuclease of toxin-antitoxin system
VDLLLDTHALVWWDVADARLSAAARAAITNPASDVYVSAASVWEIAVKQRVGRIPFAGSPIAAIQRNGFISLPISEDHAEAAAMLPPIHQDPFDRILIAQALLRGLVLVTSDRFISQYAVPQLSAR